MLNTPAVSGQKKTRKSAPPSLPNNPCGMGEEEMAKFVRSHCDLLEPLVGLLSASPHLPNRTLIEAIRSVITASEDPLKGAFLSRSCTAMVRLSSALSPQVLGEVVGQSTDYEVLLHALEEPETLATLQKEDPLAEARLRGLERRVELLKAEGGSLGVNEVAARLGITRQAVDKRRRNRQLLALPLGQNRYAYPAWQFTEKGVLPGLEEVLRSFQEDAPWSNAAFFLSRSYALEGKRPLDELRQGNVEGVKRAAALRGEPIAV